MWIALTLLMACTGPTQPPPQPDAPPEPQADQPDETPPPAGNPREATDPLADCPKVYTEDDANKLFSWGRALTFTPCSFEKVNVRGNKVEIVVEDAEEKELSLWIHPASCAKLAGEGAEEAGHTLFQISDELRSTCPAGIDAMLASAKAGSMPGSSDPPSKEAEPAPE